METIGGNIRVSEDERLTGIAGWLTFALIMLCLTTLGLVFAIASPFFAPPVTGEAWVGIGFSSVLLLYAGWVLFNFFGHKRRTRLLAIIFFGALAALNILSFLALVMHPTSDISGVVGTIRGLIISVPLTGYFIFSRRVKNTFVN